MSVRVAVADPLPLFRRGMTAALSDAGVFSETPDDLLAWARNGRSGIVFLTLSTGDDWALLNRLHRAEPEAMVVAVLDEGSVGEYVRAISAGAVGAMPRDATPVVMRETLATVMSGRSLVPIEVLRSLAALRSSPAAGAEPPSAAELGWLRQLAKGATIARLADAAGYSERMMFRLLRDLYRRLGVDNRTEALMYAREQGWL